MMQAFRGFEQRTEPMITRAAFAQRMVHASTLWLILTAIGLAIGMAGYAGLEGMPASDAFLNAAMILSGMGPVTPLATTAGKLFAGFYAILSGLFIVIATSFVLAPVFHRVLHRFHADESDQN